MITYSLITPNKFRDISALEKDKLLEEKIGINIGLLSEARKGITIERMRKTIPIAVDGLIDKYGDGIVLSSQFTTMFLAALIDNEWEDADLVQRRVSTALRRNFRDDMKALEEESSITAPYSHFLREEFGLYEGNLLEAKRKFQELEVSHIDLLRSVRVPLEMDDNLAFLAGVVVADGLPDFQKSDFTSIVLPGGKDDTELYRDLNQRLWESFHIWREPKTRVREENLQELSKDKEYDYDKYNWEADTIVIGSSAVRTYFTEVLNFPIDKTSYDFPKNMGDGCLKSYFGGMVSAKGRRINKSVIMYCDNIHKLEFIKRVSEKLGYTPSLIQFKGNNFLSEKDSNRLSFIVSDSVKIAEKYQHLPRIKETFGDLIPPKTI